MRSAEVPGVVKRSIRWADSHDQPLVQTRVGLTGSQLMGKTGFQDTTLDCPDDTQLRRQIHRRLAHLLAVGGVVDPRTTERYRTLYDLGAMMALSIT